MSPAPTKSSEKLAHISIVWEFRKSAASSPQVVIILPTFKRPDHLRQMLSSILDHKTSVRFAIVVMDNDAENAEGAQAARDHLDGAGVDAVVLLALKRGNCSAYNAGIETALAKFPDAEWIQIIDDDELAQQGWLDAMVETAETFQADFVGAPQHPIFPDGTDPRWAHHPVFRPPYELTGPVPILYSSGNVLMSVNRLKKLENPWFDERFNFLGGGDSDLYSRCRSDGARFAWCAEAGVLETTPARRTELSWLNSRSLRNGSISALIQHKAARSPLDHIKRIVKTCLLLAASPYRSLILFVKTRSITMALNPINVAIGRLLMEFGFANEQYRAADKN